MLTKISTCALRGAIESNVDQTDLIQPFKLPKAAAPALDSFGATCRSASEGKGVPDKLPVKIKTCDLLGARESKVD